MPPLIDAFQMLAAYNRAANAQLYEQVAKLDDAAYRQQRKGSFGSIHALLNHILLGDRIWMSRFEGGGKTTPPLDTILYQTFAELGKARVEEDANIEAFFRNLDDEFLSRPLAYTNSLGIQRCDRALKAVLHCFNHQTHHRGQVHVMLSQTGVKPPSLDLHRLIQP